jgi:hypothetical protein
VIVPVLTNTSVAVPSSNSIFLGSEYQEILRVRFSLKMRTVFLEISALQSRLIFSMAVLSVEKLIAYGQIFYQ